MMCSCFTLFRMFTSRSSNFTAELPAFKMRKHKSSRMSVTTTCLNIKVSYFYPFSHIFLRSLFSNDNKKYFHDKIKLCLFFPQFSFSTYNLASNHICFFDYFYKVPTTWSLSCHKIILTFNMLFGISFKIM